MSNETEMEFVGGLIVKPPRDGAPEFVKAKLSFNLPEFIEWAQAKVAKGDKWANADVKESKGGKWYAAVDPWKPKESGDRPASSGGHTRSASTPGARSRPVEQTGDAFQDDSIPFCRQARIGEL